MKDISNYLEHRRINFIVLILSLLIVQIMVIMGRLYLGDMDIPFMTMFRSLNPFDSLEGVNAQQVMVVRLIRLPRILSAVGAGVSLSICGIVLQGILGNPLAEPYTLGIASGAAFGASAAILMGWMVTPFAFAGAMGALFLVFFLAWRSGGGTSVYMVLAGIVVSSILSAGVTLLKALAGDQVAGIVFWLMGSFSGASWQGVGAAWAGAFFIGIPAFILSGALDAIALGGKKAFYLGINEKKLRLSLLAIASLATALTVASFGIIGFIGLVAPHLLRIYLGPSHRTLIPAAALTGGILLSVADGVVRASGELPVGVVTALVGGPIFCWILVRQRGKFR